jgi:hypothetical protein
MTSAPTERTVRIRFTPHEAQARIMASKARFRAVCCGRRWGKTLCFAAELLRKAGETRGDYGWIGPWYQTTERGVDALQSIAGTDAVTFHGQGPRCAHVLGGSRIYYLSADRPDIIRGFGFRGVVVDEAPYIDIDAWQKAIRPTLSDHEGWAALVGTPKGRNWFHDIFTRGTSAEPGFESFVFPSATNPHFPAGEIEEARNTLPADVFRQEYMAEFLEDSAGVFRGVDACLLLETGTTYLRSGSHTIGVDLAKHVDWTVALAVDNRTRVAFAMDRFNRLDWPVQKERLADFQRQHGGKMYVDSTGVGDPVYDELRNMKLPVEGVRIGSEIKTQLIQGLMVAVEQRNIRWPAAWTVLTDEMKRYEYEYSPGGHLSYSAPSGYHDDCVMALALAVAGAKGTGPISAIGAAPRHSTATRPQRIDAMRRREEDDDDKAGRARGRW